MKDLLATCSLVLALGATAWAQAPPEPRAVSEPGAATVLRVSVLGRPIGHETSELRREDAGLVLESDLELTERGSHLALHARLELGAGLEPRRFRALGQTYRFVHVDVDWRASDDAQNRQAGDRGVGDRPVFPAMGYAPLSARAPLIRSWDSLGRPPSLRLVPAPSEARGSNRERRARIEARGVDTVQLGDRQLRLTRYTVEGVVWGRETVWLDDSGDVAAVRTRIHILPLEAVRPDLADQLPRLEESAIRDRLEDLARLAAETPVLASGTYALVGARLIDGTGSEPLDDSVVLLRDGRIAAVGSSAEVAVPRGVQAIDLSGKTIAPGLWDLHAHASQIEWAPAYLAAGVTSIRDMGGERRLLTAMRDAITDGRAVGPRLHLAGLVDGDSRLALGTVTAATPEQGRAVVESYAQAGYEQIKLYWMLEPEVMAAIIARAHELGLSVTGHVPNAVTLEQAIRLGMDQVAHLPPLGEPGSTERRATIALLAEHRVVVDPTLPWNELLGRAPSTPIVSFEPGFPQAPPTLQLAYESVHNDIDEAGAAAGRRAAGAAVASLHLAGVPIVAGTDGAVPGVSLVRSLELFVDAGLTPGQALYAATLGAAKALGVSEQVGSIEVGKVADLVVVDGDPLTEISALRRLHRVVAAGRLYDPEVFVRQALGR